jgi:hypothetical protein
MTRREGIGAVVSTILFISATLGHLQLSLWLVVPRRADWLGTYRLADLLPVAGAMAAVVFIAWQAWRARHGTARGATMVAWASWIATVIAIDRTLIYSFPEYLHYPQYALLAWLMAVFADPHRKRWPIGPILLAATLLGIADEALQYAWITKSYSNYLDFNDFLLNLMGAAAGLLAYYGFTTKPLCSRMPAGRILGPAGFAALGAILLAGVCALELASTAGGNLAFIERQTSYGRWIPGNHAGRYYVLPPIAGTLLLTGSGLLASALPHILARARPVHLSRKARNRWSES